MNREGRQTQVMPYFSVKAPRFAKTPMLYEVRILCYYRQNTKQNQQFCTILYTEAPKTGKKLKLEDPIPNKYELRLLIVGPGRYE